MSEDNARLSQIATMWTIIRQAHEERLDAKLQAQTEFFERYQRAIERYLYAVLRNPDAVQDVFQEFAESFIKGGFQHADPERGKFRSYLKTSLINQSRKYLRQEGRRGKREMQNNPDAPEPASPQEEELGKEFDKAWKTEILKKAWHKLQEQESNGQTPYYTVLRCRSEEPDISSEELAEFVNRRLNKPGQFNAVSVRKTLQRARTKFAELLLSELEVSLETKDVEVLENEVIDLGLHQYCKSVLQSRRGLE